MHAFSAVLIYTSAIYHCFLFRIGYNFTLLTLKGSTMITRISLDKDFRIM